LGFGSSFFKPRRLRRSAIILRPATLLRFHRALRDLKYRLLYSSPRPRKPGPKGPDPELIRLICDFKRRNPRFGCPRIAQHLAKTFGLQLTWCAECWRPIIVPNLTARSILADFSGPQQG